MQHIYICFIRDNRTGVDFSTVMQAPADCHGLVKEQVARKYAGDVYTVLTTVTTTELDTMLDDIHRWCGVLPTAPQTRTLTDTPRRYSA